MINYLEDFIKNIGKLHPISIALKAALIQNSEVISFDKKNILIPANTIAKHSYVVIDGILRSYYLHDGNEITSNFIMQGDIIIHLTSYYNNAAEAFTIETITPVVLAKISHTQLDILFKKYLELNYIARILAHQYIIKSDERLQMLRKLTAAEKWKLFCDQHAEWLQQIPLTYIATYLGMNLETLSRTRKKASLRI
jgi:CRP/FNR family transcriptional regulator, anaerobic regulatory protein